MKDPLLIKGVFLYIVVMKIRNPFKDYLCRFKDDATKTEKTVWTLVLIYFGYALGHVLVYFIF